MDSPIKLDLLGQPLDDTKKVRRGARSDNPEILLLEAIQSCHTYLDQGAEATNRMLSMRYYQNIKHRLDGYVKEIAQSKKELTALSKRIQLAIKDHREWMS